MATTCNITINKPHVTGEARGRQLRGMSIAVSWLLASNPAVQPAPRLSAVRRGIYGKKGGILGTVRGGIRFARLLEMPEFIGRKCDGLRLSACDGNWPPAGWVLCHWPEDTSLVAAS
jgi:hypothetical protein